MKVMPGKGGSRQQIAQFAVERKENATDDYDEVWCVMDVEHPDGLDAMREALKMLEKHGIQAALSNPAIEVWFLAHFERTGAGFFEWRRRRRAVEQVLERAIPNELRQGRRANLPLARRPYRSSNCKRDSGCASIIIPTWPSLTVIRQRMWTCWSANCAASECPARAMNSSPTILTPHPPVRHRATISYRISM